MIDLKMQYFIGPVEDPVIILYLKPAHISRLIEYSMTEDVMMGTLAVGSEVHEN